MSTMINVVSPNPEPSVELKRAWNDLLRNANTGMMSWAEKNFKQKLIDILFEMDYYKYNQTIYLNDSKKEKS